MASAARTTPPSKDTFARLESEAAECSDIRSIAVLQLNQRAADRPPAFISLQSFRKRTRRVGNPQIC